MSNVPSFVVVDERAVRTVIEPNRAEVLDVVRYAYELHHDGASALPHSTFLRFPDRPADRIIALPAFLGGDIATSGVKWIASYPGNLDQGIPRASAVLVLNDTATGRPLACLASSLISASRTAASAVLGAELLQGSRRASRVGILGAGVIAGAVVDFFAAAGWEIGAWRVVDTVAERAEAFATRLRSGDVRTGTDAALAFAECDVVVVATVAGQPHLHDPALLAHAPTVLHLSLRDLSPELVLASQNFTDDVDHAVRAATSLELAEQRSGDREFIAGTVGDLLTGAAHRDPGRAAVFSPFGLGILDIAVGRWVYDRVVAAGGGTRVDDFLD
ncbi:ornithine cyclodeaminase [Jatrophihabitans endophyticus]|uniref:Ornithine cyclodeaminase n=1 Tax=Jatrophihabitans endophyticus TaxID=1206085 RepID=A0A1M5CS06_9ACTN|nr:2,3-diaminopropionate biosynthesis protein SbnB [Jatrophihabitans endophyticus]SHF57528.1 ornithine cyclodeaminase [Jatrophihabitans endophyticus]